MAFGQQMIYTLLRKLGSLEDRSLNLIQKDFLEIVRSRAGEIMQQQYENNERQYNLRAVVVNFVEDQEVFRRNFKQSNFADDYNANHGPRFLKAKRLLDRPQRQRQGHIEVLPPTSQNF